MENISAISFRKKNKKLQLFVLKKIRSTFVIIPALLILFSSCKKFLDTTPTDFIQTNAFYQTKDQFVRALAAIYNPMMGGTNLYGRFFWQATQECTDEAYKNSAGVFINSYDYTNADINFVWRDCYSSIEKANVLIANKKNAVNIDNATLDELIGEAKFLRGWYYFLLVQNFGDVPLKLTPTTDPNNVNIPRTPVKDVYAQIVKDMTEAEAVLYLPNSTELGNASSRVSKTTAAGILARVCLFMAGYPLRDQSQFVNALKWAQKVQASGIHRLTVDTDTMTNVVNLRGTPLAYPATNGNPAYKNNGYAQVFINEAMGLYNVKETMWEADPLIQASSRYLFGMIGGQIGILCSNDFVLGRCSGDVLAQHYLWNLYGSGDLRRDWAIAPYSYGNLVPAVRKFLNGAPGTSIQILNRYAGKWRREYEPMEVTGFKSGWNTNIKYPLLRYSDVLLMLAEAEFMINGASQTALDAINQVRRRGHGLDPNNAAPEVDFTSSTLTLSAIQDERARELCFESLRKNDLMRWGIYLQRAQDVINFNSVNGYPPGNRTAATVGVTNTIAGGNKFLLWPIPSSEMLVNKAMVQNPGW